MWSKPVRAFRLPAGQGLQSSASYARVQTYPAACCAGTTDWPLYSAGFLPVLLDACSQSGHCRILTIDFTRATRRDRCGGHRQWRAEVTMFKPFVQVSTKIRLSFSIIGL